MQVRQQTHFGEQEARSLSGATVRWSGGLMIAGLLLLGLGVVLGFMRGDKLTYFFHAYLVAFCFYLSISLGGLFFVALQHAARAGWSVAVRRVGEIIAANTLLMVVLFLPLLVPILMGNASLYEWLDLELVTADPILDAKSRYLNLPFFTARALLYFGIWCALVWYFWRKSLEQDHTGSPDLSLRMERVSYPALILFALTVTFASFDWLMSLTPHWFSTIFGVYYFSGCAVGFLAFAILCLYVLQRLGFLTSSVNTEHYHELGKLLFAFIVFWGYIAFSQYMLIWYANVPEETVWYMPRQEHSWAVVSLILIFGHLFVPFLGLLSRSAKRRPAILAGWAAWMLVMHWLDLQYIVMPNIIPEGFPVAPIDVCCMFGMGGVFVAGLLVLAGDRSLTPVKDPRALESLGFENS
jgi:hypothetical protein